MELCWSQVRVESKSHTVVVGCVGTSKDQTSQLEKLPFVISMIYIINILCLLFFFLKGYNF